LIKASQSLHIELVYDVIDLSKHFPLLVENWNYADCGICCQGRRGVMEINALYLHKSFDSTIIYFKTGLLYLTFFLNHTFLNLILSICNIFLVFVVQVEVLELK
jgi:hypothetical protein